MYVRRSCILISINNFTHFLINSNDSRLFTEIKLIKKKLVPNVVKCEEFTLLIT